MVNKATASITRSQEEPNLKRPMIPLRFISKPAELGTTHGLARWWLGLEPRLCLCTFRGLGPLSAHLQNGDNNVYTLQGNSED